MKRLVINAVAWLRWLIPRIALQAWRVSVALGAEPLEAGSIAIYQTGMRDRPSERRRRARLASIVASKHEVPAMQLSNDGAPLPGGGGRLPVGKP